MRQKKNHDMRNWFLGTVVVGGLVLDLAKTLNEKKVQEPNLETKVVQIDESAQVKNKVVENVNDINFITKYKTNNFSQDSNEVLLARMLFGEARNCDKYERIDIAFTPINRANNNKKWDGETFREAILKPWQYSCFNKNDINFEKTKDPLKYDAESFCECLVLAQEILSGKYKEFNQGQTHYFNPNVIKPNWAEELTKVERPGKRKHEFYKEKD